MFYYRYRSGSELSIKELIYNEIYFSSTAECNDPYEGKAFAVLGKNEEAWAKLVQIALKNNHAFAIEALQKKLVNFFVGKAPLYIDEIMGLDTDSIFHIADNEIEKIILENMLKRIKDFISLYIPAEKYFASFSKKNDNLLMWSHYANNHRGYCLIFQARDGKIYQDIANRRRSVSFVTPKSFSPKMQLDVPESFSLRDIDYLVSPQYIDGFMCFPESISGGWRTEEEKKKFQIESGRIYFQKHKVWDYEEESRIVLSSGSPWLAGERLSLTAHQRLFHFDSTQLVGIILGVKMSKEQRHRIREIIADKVSHWYDGSGTERIISNFVLFEEELSEANREVQIKPVEIIDGHTSIKAGEPAFESRFTAWKDGEALHFSGTKCSKIQIK